MPSLSSQGRSGGLCAVGEGSAGQGVCPHLSHNAPAAAESQQQQQLAGRQSLKTATNGLSTVISNCCRGTWHICISWLILLPNSNSKSDFDVDTPVATHWKHRTDVMVTALSWMNGRNKRIHEARWDLVIIKLQSEWGKMSISWLLFPGRFIGSSSGRSECRAQRVKPRVGACITLIKSSCFVQFYFLSQWPLELLQPKKNPMWV